MKHALTVVDCSIYILAPGWWHVGVKNASSVALQELEHMISTSLTRASQIPQVLAMARMPATRLWLRMPSKTKSKL